ncbi:MAG: electron transfer flavoprotein subunit alpha/FixB family protein [Limnochordia bacterium]|jgi:electron transfer flavoprotein alpha subunit
MAEGLWIYVEIGPQGIHPVVYELLGVGRSLAQTLDMPLVAVALGGELPDLEDLFQYGADEVYQIEASYLAPYRAEVHGQVLAQLWQEKLPAIALFGGTIRGRSLAPRVAALLETGLTADATALEVDAEGHLLATLPACGDRLMATIICPHRHPQMATVRPGIFPPPQPDGTRQGSIIPWSPPEEIIPTTQILAREEEGDVLCPLADAEVIFAGGRGLGGPDGFALLAEVAALMGGAVGATRAAVDAGWAEEGQMIGQTGLIVRPKLYVACGISGATQHLVGMEQADTIIAINKDPHAAIFDVATYGIVADAREALEEMKRALTRQGPAPKKE